MDIIHLLPDEVANQIAAGEVVQRPASVIKELVENSIDAGAQHIQIIVKDGGRTLIQIIDDGKGMSATDARMAFERHATSKIRKADDLFSLHTMGFRGEALASIAAVAQVELLTCPKDESLGTHISIAGGRIESQEPAQCAPGSNFSVKNLFFNIPARRKFLKANSTEFSHIEKSFISIALVYPQISFEMINDDKICFSLPASTLRDRICNIFGKSLNSQLFSIKTETTIVNISGFVGKPETAKKQNDKQYFFVNGRYMRHPYFQKAVIQAYGSLIQVGTSPSFFLYFDVNPATIDVNIHPTKTEIKFENEKLIWPIIGSAIREVLGRFNVSDAIDFDQSNSIDMLSYLNLNKEVKAPEIHINKDYDPFRPQGGGNGGSGYSPNAESNKRNWEDLFSDFESHKANQTQNLQPDESEDYEQHGEVTFTNTEETEGVQQELDLGIEDQELPNNFIQFQNKYIITTVKSGILCIDQHRAHFRILYDHFLQGLSQHKSASQALLYPETIELSPADAAILHDITPELEELGYDVACLGNTTFVVNAVPTDQPDANPQHFIQDMIDAVKNEDMSAKDTVLQKMALTLARAAAIPAGRKLTHAEISDLVGNLFARPEHNLTPDNKFIITTISGEELERKLR